jgi:uncharacterized protein (DUF58 family)
MNPAGVPIPSRDRTRGAGPNDDTSRIHAIRFLASLSSAVRHRLHYRVTLGGVFYIFAVLLVGFAAFRTGNNLLFLVFSAMLAILLVSGFLSRLTLSGLELELLLPEHVWARTAAPARIRLRNLKRLTPSFSLELSGQPPRDSNTPPILTGPVYFPIIPGRTTVEASIEVTFPRRGRHKENVFHISTRFPFGFLRKTTTLALQRETIVYPAPEPFPGAAGLLGQAAGEMEMSVRGLGKDFYRIRPYEPGDSARHIDWKSSAHTGVPHVREFSRDEQAVVEIFLDRRTAAGGTRTFEASVERCAFLISHLRAGDNRVLLRTQGFARMAADDDEFYVMLKVLALIEPLIAVTSGVESESDFSAGGVRVVFTSRPGDFQETEWPDAYFVEADE